MRELDGGTARCPFCGATLRRKSRPTPPPIAAGPGGLPGSAPAGGDDTFNWFGGGPAPKPVEDAASAPHKKGAWVATLMGGPAVAQAVAAPAAAPAVQAA